MKKQAVAKWAVTTKLAKVSPWRSFTEKIKK
jgi:hypothetical protein